jgi:hypothetical protein
LSPGGAGQSTDAVDATWGNLPVPGTYGITPTIQSPYTSALACWTRDNPLQTIPVTSNTASLSVPDSTLTWTIAYRTGAVPADAWSQANGGDVYAARNVGSNIPPGSSPRAFVTAGSGGYPGVVTYGNGYNFDGAGNGEEWVSATKWLAKDSYPSKDYYTTMKDLMSKPFGGEPPAASWDYTAETTQLDQQPSYKADMTKPFYVRGDLEISGNWNVTAGNKLLFIVAGNLTITGADTTIKTTDSGFIAFAVSGDIIVAPSVGTTYDSSTSVLDGVYISSGTFHTGTGTSVNNERFVGKGVFVANDFSLERNLNISDNNAAASAELFIYDPRILITMPDSMRA